MSGVVTLVGQGSGKVLGSTTSLDVRNAWLPMLSLVERKLGYGADWGWWIMVYGVEWMVVVFGDMGGWKCQRHIEFTRRGGRDETPPL